MREALVSARARVSLVCLFVLVLITAANPSPAQSTNELSQVKKLYVDSFGLDTGAIEMRAQIVRRLRKSHKIRVVPNLRDADAALRGTGRVWTIGHISVSPRSHGPSQATLQGFLSAEVVGQDNRTVWSYLVTPSGVQWGSITDNLAKQLVSKLLAEISNKAQLGEASPAEATTRQTVTLRGAGATFPAPLYQEWFEVYESDHPGVHVHYDAVGSGNGIQRLKGGAVDFGASEMPLSDRAMSEDGEHFFQIPVVLGGLVAIYNVKHLSQNLNFTSEVLAGIYLGQIKRWNDPQIKRVNPATLLFLPTWRSAAYRLLIN